MICRVSAARVLALSLPQTFLVAPEAQRILAGGETTGQDVIIDVALRQERGTRKSSSFTVGPAPHPGRDNLPLRFRWFHHRLISTALPGQKAGIAKRESFG